MPDSRRAVEEELGADGDDDDRTMNGEHDREESGMIADVSVSEDVLEAARFRKSASPNSRL